ncbi:hypothetical protein CsSME_00052192 [Camellia sinensis var. sinensis]
MKNKKINLKKIKFKKLKPNRLNNIFTFSFLSLNSSFGEDKEKMLFYFTTLNLTRFLHENAHTLKEDKIDQQVVVTVDAWKHADFLCRNYILIGLDNTLYNFNGNCYICDEEGHRVKDCRSKGKSKRRSSKKSAQANITEMDKISNGVDDINLFAVGHAASRLCAHYLCCPSLDRWQCSPLTTSRVCPLPHAIGPSGSLNRSTTTGLVPVESCHHKQHNRAVSRRPIPRGRSESLILMAELLLVGPSWLIGREAYRPPPVLPSFSVIRNLTSCLIGQPLQSCKTGRRAASGEKIARRRAICHDPCYRSLAVLTGASLPSQLRLNPN